MEGIVPPEVGWRNGKPIKAQVVKKQAPPRTEGTGPSSTGLETYPGM